MEREVRARRVQEVTAPSGATRWVLRDDEGNEYTTFRPQVGREATRLEGQRVLVAFHEEDRRGFHNVYLDRIAPLRQRTSGGEDRADRGSNGGEGDDSRHPDESAWDTALEAAPWLVGTPEPREACPPEELYDRLHPFKELVAEDIRRPRSEEQDRER